MEPSKNLESLNPPFFVPPGEPVWRISPRHCGGRSGKLSATQRDPWVEIPESGLPDPLSEVKRPSTLLSKTMEQKQQFLYGKSRNAIENHGKAASF